MRILIIMGNRLSDIVIIKANENLSVNNIINCQRKRLIGLSLAN